MGDDKSVPFEIACGLMKMSREAYAESRHLDQQLREYCLKVNISRTSISKELNKREIRNKKLQNKKEL
jgi:hypothetical protein